MSIDARLAELGLELPSPSAPGANYWDGSSASRRGRQPRGSAP
jgi:hypothetical protein